MKNDVMKTKRVAISPGLSCGGGAGAGAGGESTS